MWFHPLRAHSFSRNLLFIFKKKGENSLGSSQHSTASCSLQGWQWDFKSSVCDNEEVAMGNRPTAVCCQYRTMLLSLLAVSRSLIFPSLMPLSSCPHMYLHSTALSPAALHGYRRSRERSDPAWCSHQRGRLRSYIHCHAHEDYYSL